MLHHVLIASAMTAFMVFLAACEADKSSPDEKSTPAPAKPQSTDTPSHSTPPTPAPKPVPALLDFTMDDINGQPLHLADFAGKVVLFVNVASKCGYTKQYPALEELHKKYKDRGLVLVGVPANDFGGQEPGTNAQIAEFCSTTYGVTFPMLAKVSVKDPDPCPLYQRLVEASTTNGLAETGPVKWNFEKFLLDRNGNLVARFRSATTPTSDELTSAIEKALGS